MDVPMDVIKSTYEVLTFSVIRLTKAVFPHMAARKSGEIVNIGSIGGDMYVPVSSPSCQYELTYDHRPTPWNGGYSSAKAAVRGISDVLWQEFKPFNINVTHVSAGAVKSNIAKKALAEGVYTSDTSPYKPYAGLVVQRIWASQGPNSLPAEEFSKQVVTASLSPSPPRYMTLGGASFLFWVFSWLPRGVALHILWRKFSSLRSG